MVDAPFLFKPTTVARAARGALLAACAGLAALPAVHAQAATSAEAATAGKRSYEIAAGPLGSVLSRFAGAAGVVLSFDAAVTAGKQSEGLRGSFTVDEGLAQLLAGHELQAVRGADGIYVLRPGLRLSNRSDASLPGLSVRAAADTPTTEGSGSYTTRSMNSATKLDLSIRETPQSVSVITRQQIEDQNITTVSQALERSVGISVAQGETDRAETTSRGFYANAIRIDGMPTFAVGMHEEAMQADTAVYDRVEIVRGATGLLTGNGEPSASLNLVRKRPTREFQGYAAGGLGRWDAGRVEVDVSGPLDANGGLRGRLVGAVRDTQSHVDKFHNRREVLYGVVETDLSTRTTLTGGLQWRRSESNGMTYGQPVPMFYSDGSLTHLPRNTTSGADWTYLDTDTLNVFGELKHRFGKDWEATARLERQHIDSSNRMVYLFGAPDRLTGEGVGTYYNSYDSNGRQDSVDLFLSGGFDLFGRRHEATVGWSASNAPYQQKYHPLLDFTALVSYDGWRSHPEPTFGTDYGNRYDYLTRQDGLYVATRWQVAEPVRLIVGARRSDIRYREVFTAVGEVPSETVAEHRNVLTPYGGLVIDLAPNVSAYGSYTQIFRFQTAKDRAGARLDPVTGTNVEAGLKAEFNEKRLVVSAAVFKIDQDNVAEFDTVVDGEDRFRGVKGTRSKGFEIEIAGQVMPGWQLNAGFSRRVTRDALGQPLMSEQPSKLFRLTTSHKLTKSLEGLTVGAHVSWQSETRVAGSGPNGEDAVQRGYALLHLFASYQVGPRLQVQANLDNVFDKTYYKGFYNWGYYGEPRQLNLSARYAF